MVQLSALTDFKYTVSISCFFSSTFKKKKKLIDAPKVREKHRLRDIKV